MTAHPTSTPTPTPTPTTFVLVPGAWMGSWSWFPVARLLSERGHHVVALTLPGLSYGSSPVGLAMTDAVDAVVDEIERRDLRDVVLVGHSWGGYPVTGAAHRIANRIKRVVFHNAVVPAPQCSMSDENEEYAALIRALIAASKDGTVPLSLEAVQTGFLPGEPAALQQLVFSLALPQPGGYMTQALDCSAIADLGLPTTYVLSADDIALARPGIEYADRLHVDPVMVPGSHLTMLTKPGPVADVLDGLV